MANTSDFNPGVLLVALLIIVGFIAIFSRRFRWDQQEQRYIEILAREARTREDEKKNLNLCSNLTKQVVLPLPKPVTPIQYVVTTDYLLQPRPNLRGYFFAYI